MRDRPAGCATCASGLCGASAAGGRRVAADVDGLLVAMGRCWRASLVLDARLQLVFVVKDPATDLNPRRAFICFLPTLKRALADPEHRFDPSLADQSSPVNDDFIASGYCLWTDNRRERDKGRLVRRQESFGRRRQRDLSTIGIKPRVAQQFR